MSGREAGREPLRPDSLEVVPGADRDRLEGWVPELASEEELHSALESAFGYRGDVTITLEGGEKVEGYIFDRRGGRTLADSFVRLIRKADGQKISVCYASIAALAFTGRDMAAGRNWENWVRQYWEKKMAGEKNISLQPEELE